MLIIQAPKNIQPIQVEGFSDETKRSVKGALHIMPGATKEITEDEFDVIKKKYPEISKKLRVISLAKKKSISEVKPKPEAASGVEVEPETKVEKKSANGTKKASK